jgi:hypothetical protein
MADVLDVFGFSNLPFGAGSAIAGLKDPGINTSNGWPALISNVPVPGDTDTGGIIGSIIDLVGGWVGGRTPMLPQLPPAPGGTPPLLPGRIPPAALAPGAGGCPTAVCCPGKHLDKATGTKCVSNRRMNPLNPQALRRAIRRAKGFERFVKSNRKSLRSLAKI